MAQNEGTAPVGGTGTAGAAPAPGTEPAGSPPESTDPATTDESAPEGSAVDVADIRRRLNAEAKAYKERARAAETAAKTAETAKQTAEERVKELEALVPNLQAELIRERVARKVGLPEGWADRLRGATEEDVLKDAETLLATFGPAATKPPPPKGRPVESLQPGTGAKPDGKPAQATQAELDRMTPDQIMVAKRAGRLNDLLGISP